jgi:hypothetical protein
MKQTKQKAARGEVPLPFRPSRLHFTPRSMTKVMTC